MLSNENTNEQLYGAYRSAVVLRMTVIDTCLRARASRRCRGTSCLKAETRICKGISPFNRDWRPLNLTCCKHDKQRVRLQEMKTFECQGIILSLTITPLTAVSMERKLRSLRPSQNHQTLTSICNIFSGGNGRGK